MRMSNVKKKVLRWIASDIQAKKKRVKKQIKKDEAYHKMINSRSSIYG